MNYAPAPDIQDGPYAALRVRATATRDLSSLESAWRAFEATAVGHVFQTYDFVTAWCEQVAPAEEIEPVIVTGTADDGRLVYLLPLGSRRKLGSRAIEWLGGDQADYLGGLFDAGYFAHIAADGNAFGTFLETVVDAIGGADLLHFTKMPAQYRGTPSPFLQAEKTYPNANGAHATLLAPDWGTYYKAKRKSGWRRTDRAKERQLAGMGDVSFVVATDRATADAILDALIEQKRAWLARLGADDIFAADGTVAFYRHLAHDSVDGRGSARLAALTCGDRIAAASYGFAFRDTYYYVLHSYDLDTFVNASPGRQLMYRLMQWAFNNRLTAFDFTIGDEAYKDSWCEIRLDLVDAAVPLTATGSVSSNAVRLWQHTKRQIKKDETLWSAAVGVRKALKTLKRS